MKFDKDTEKEIIELQMMEQNLNNFSLQKQNFNANLLEIENALNELKNCKGETYKIVGGIMISSEKEGLEKDLNEKKGIIELRIKNIEKQEEKIKDKASELQKKVMKKLQDGKKQN